MPWTPERRRSLGKVRVVAVREFSATVFRWGYLATLVILPLVMVGLSVLPTVAVSVGGGPHKILGLPDATEVSHVAVVDPHGFVDDRWIDWHNEAQRMAADAAAPLSEAEIARVKEIMDLPIPDRVLRQVARSRRSRGGFDDSARLDFRRMGDRESAVAAVLAGELQAAFVVPEAWAETSRVEVLVEADGNRGLYPGRIAMGRLLRKSVAGRHITDPDLLDRMVRVMDPKLERLAPAGEKAAPSGLQEILGLLIPLMIAAFFTLSIFVSSGYLLDGIGEEKENRVLEVLLASLTPEELLLGKMIGLGGAGLLQACVFAAMTFVPMATFGLLVVGAGTVVGMGLCAVLGFVQFASLMGATGAVAGNRHEGRQLSALWTMIAASPLFLLPVFLSDAGGGIAMGLSIFPLTAPVAMTLRLGLDTVPWWQLALGYASMGATAWVSWRAGSRVFRVALLMSGARPPLRRIWQWVRTG
jgi:ABC-2 type transport system permease protein